MAAKPKTIDEFLAEVSQDKRATLQKLRKTVKSIVPDAEECISYGIPGFRHHGKVLVWFGAGANHCSFFPASTAIAKYLHTDLKNYDTSKGTIRFPVNKPLPASLVKKLVKARMAEVEGKNSKSRVRKTSNRKPSKIASKTDTAVDTFMKSLAHPQKAAVEAVRQIILAADPGIHEGIKWNSPSFRTSEYFATLNLRDDRVWLILHLGAKIKDHSTKGMKIDDPTRLLKWLSKNRCLVTLRDRKDVAAKRNALIAVLKQWIQWV